MTFRKGFLFVSAVVLILLVVAPKISVAKEISLEMPATEILNPYDFKEDPYALEWSFQLRKAISVKEELSYEDKLLAHWKKKQVKMWSSLPKGKFLINASAYTAAADECGKSDGITSSGLMVEENRTLACPPAYPFGAKVRIEGVGELRCEDRGGAIKGNHFDIYMKTKAQAFGFGRKYLMAEVVK